MLLYIKDASPWMGEPINDITHQLNIGDVWSIEELNAVGLGPVVAFVVPENKRPFGEPTYTLVDNSYFQESYEVEDLPLSSAGNVTSKRRFVRKSIIIRRLANINKLADVISILDMPENLYTRERWRAPDWPAVYFDDPDVIAILTTVGADPNVIMAEGDS